MQLSTLLTGIISFSSPEVEVSGITNDSRGVCPGFLFLAYPGEKTDGRDYVSQAILQGAVAVLYEENSGFSAPSHVPCFALKDLSHIQSEIAARFYDHSSQKMNMIGVTGTNGKTSITHFIAECFGYFQKKCAVIGTIGCGFLPNLGKATLTTPDPVQLQKMFYDLHEQGADYVAMEVSSHALEQGRVAAVDFDVAVFTQLSRDHLDYHGTMENYARAKAKLFAFPNLKYGVINWDDPLGKKMALAHQRDYSILLYAVADRHIPEGIPALVAHDIEVVPHGFLVTVQSPWGEGQFLCTLMGRFNISNVLAALGALIASGIDFVSALASLNEVRPVAGRMQVIRVENGPTAVVDYSHTPDALAKALQALREHCRGKLYCVFGCGGDRDPGKRPKMGQIAEKYADFSIVTNDNPRTEDPEQIAQAILNGMSQKNKLKLLLDRREAIQFAIDNAHQDDMILFAGKGHENYQVIGTQTLPFDEVMEVRLALKNKVQA
jgi:UDP-N-acetylmuramoyl-L-alanyl-D-glutamate--2,6-diaminopimelate ligase